MENKKLGKLVLKCLLIMKNGGLVGQECEHVGPEGLYILTDEDTVLKGLIPVGLETGCEVKHRVLEDSGRTDRILLLGRWWWRGGSLWRWWMGGGFASGILGVSREAKLGLILAKLLLIRGFIARVRHYLRSWYTRLVTLDHNCLDWLYPRLSIL